MSAIVKVSEFMAKEFVSIQGHSDPDAEAVIQAVTSTDIAITQAKCAGTYRSFKWLCGYNKRTRKK
jgi:hypothetical protein